MGYDTMETLIKYLKGELAEDEIGQTIWIPGKVLSRTDPASIDEYEELLLSSK